MKAFGGGGLYVDKTMLNHLGVLIGDEIVIEFKEEGLLLKKPEFNAEKIQELLEQSKTRN